MCRGATVARFVAFAEDYRIASAAPARIGPTWSRRRCVAILGRAIAPGAMRRQGDGAAERRHLGRAERARGAELETAERERA